MKLISKFKDFYDISGRAEVIIEKFFEDESKKRIKDHETT